MRAGATARRGARIFADTRPPEVEEEAVAADPRRRLAGRRGLLPRPPVHGGSARPGAAGAAAAAAPGVRRGLHAPPDARRGRYAGPDAGRYLVAPPLRATRHVEALWAGWPTGRSTRSGPTTARSSPRPRGPWPRPATTTEYGLAGHGARLPLLLSEGRAGACRIEHAGAARGGESGAGLRPFPGKGSACPGADADIVVFDPAWRDRAAGRRVRRRDRRQRLRRPARARPGPRRAAAGPAHRVRRDGRQSASRPLSASARCAGRCTLMLPRKAANAGGVEHAWRQLLSRQRQRSPRRDAHPSWIWSAAAWSSACSPCSWSLCWCSLATEVLPGNAAIAVLGRIGEPRPAARAWRRQLHLNRRAARPVLDLVVRAVHRQPRALAGQRAAGLGLRRAAADQLRRAGAASPG